MDPTDPGSDVGAQAPAAGPSPNADLIRLVADRLPDGLLVVDAQGTVLYANTAASVEFVETATRLEGANFGVPVGEGPLLMQIPSRERPRYVEVHTLGIAWEGTPATVLVLHDSTAHVEAMDDLTKQNEELEQRVLLRTQGLQLANEELEAFTYSVAHDLRAPLRSIDGFSQLVLEDAADRLDGESRRYLGRVRTAAQRMGRLIDDLLALTSLSRRPLDLVEVDLSRLAEGICGRLAEQHPKEEVGVSVAPGIRAVADAGLIEMALENLLGNAWKYTATVEAPSIAVSAEARDGRCVVCVRDNGIGFDPAFSRAIFEPFHRLQPDDAYEGTGIGLAIVQSIARRLGGDCWAEGAVGGGAAFYLSLQSPDRSCATGP